MLPCSPGSEASPRDTVAQAHAKTLVWPAPKTQNKTTTSVVLSKKSADDPMSAHHILDVKSTVLETGAIPNYTCSLAACKH